MPTACKLRKDDGYQSAIRHVVGERRISVVNVRDRPNVREAGARRSRRDHSDLNS